MNFILLDKCLVNVANIKEITVYTKEKCTFSFIDGSEKIYNISIEEAEELLKCS